MPSYVTEDNLTSNQLAVCGAIAGVISRLVIAPLDVVKIRMQLQTHRTSFSMGQPLGQGQVKYQGTWRSLKTIFMEEGIRGLYKGNLPAEYLYLSYSAVEFWTYKELESLIERVSNRTHQNPGAAHSAKTFVSGMVAGCVATTVTYPFDLLRTRFVLPYHNQTDINHYTSVPRAVRYIYHQEGFRGFYPGLWATVLQIMPYMGLLFATYDICATSLKRLRDEQILSAHHKPVHDLISGAASGLVGKSVVYPMDVVRKRLQTQSAYLGDSVGNSPRTASGISWTACLRHIIRHEGISSLYKGLAPSLVKVAPANAVTFMVYEESKQWMLRRRK